MRARWAISVYVTISRISHISFKNSEVDLNVNDEALDPVLHCFFVFCFFLNKIYLLSEIFSIDFHSNIYGQ